MIWGVMDFKSVSMAPILWYRYGQGRIQDFEMEGTHLYQEQFCMGKKEIGTLNFSLAFY